TNKAQQARGSTGFGKELAVLANARLWCLQCS
ncbi:MAG: hypothetical protein ACI8W8_003136, partial [Rhodothermales bacterium]